MLVEDDTSLLELTRKFLESCGYTVLAAGGPAEGTRIVEKHKSIPLMITDIVMSEMSGRALAEKLTAICPSTRVLYMSGYSQEIIDGYGHGFWPRFPSKTLHNKIWQPRSASC